MKISSTIILVLFCSLTAQASLKSAMKDSKFLFKTLIKQSQNASQNADSAKLADQLKQLFAGVLNDVPDIILVQPISQQGPAIAEYKKLIQAEMDLCDSLQKAFLDNDNATAGDILKQMAKVESDGHDLFK